jgi:hypothetical protein
MSEVRGTILAVNGKSTSKGTCYEVALSDGQTYSTFNNGIADAAKRLQGQPAIIQFTEKQTTKGDKVYTNLYLESVEPGAGAVETTPQAIAIKEDYQRKMAPEVEQRVTRLSVIATAFGYAGAIGADEDYALGLAKKLYQVAYYGKIQLGGEPPVTYEPAPEEIAAQVAEVVGAGTPDW